MYPKDKCYFCDSNLVAGDDFKHCANAFCNCTYTVWYDGLISITNGDYTVQFNCDGTTSIFPPHWSGLESRNKVAVVDLHLVIDKDFTIDKAKELYQKIKKLEILS